MFQYSGLTISSLLSWPTLPDNDQRSREQLGVKAFEAQDRLLKLKRQKGSNYTLGTDLVVRRSTAPVKPNGQFVVLEPDPGDVT
jgi:hypothetical protein